MIEAEHDQDGQGIHEPGTGGVKNQPVPLACVGSSHSIVPPSGVFAFPKRGVLSWMDITRLLFLDPEIIKGEYYCDFTGVRPMIEQERQDKES
jgi:hypothetical protein